jgi:hypothetical protein
MHNNIEALHVIQNLINENKKSISVYTNLDIYHLKKMGNGYSLVFESGEDFRSDDYGYIIQSIQQLKQFFKSYERISIIELNNTIVWEKYKNLERVHRDIKNYNIERIPNFNESECSICLDTLLPGKVNNRQRLQCGHTYHKNCISQIRNHKCPMCRKSIERVYSLKFGKVKKNEPSVPKSVPQSVSKKEKGLKGYIKNNPKKVGGVLALLTAGTAAAIASRKKDKKVTFTIKTTPGKPLNIISSHPASQEQLEDSDNEDPAPGVDSHPLSKFGNVKNYNIIKKHVKMLQNMKF